MTTISRERIEQYANDPRMCNVNDEIRQIARIALASLEAEPVLYMNRFTGKTFSLEGQPGADKEPEIYVPLYAAPPAPVVPDELPREYRNSWPLAYSDYAEGWNDCRAAMLQGDKS